MAPFRHLLVATDLEEASQHAVDTAVDLARGWDATLIIVHVFDVPAYSYAQGPAIGVDLYTPLLEVAEQRLASVLAQARQGYPSITSTIRSGVPWQQVLKAAEEVRADLLVVGTHGRSGLARFVMGSVAEHIVRLSPIPVLTIHPSPSDAKKAAAA